MRGSGGSARAMLGAVAISAGLVCATAVRAAPRPGPDDLPAKVIRVQCNLDVFIPDGVRDACVLRLAMPRCAPPQIPLTATVRTVPQGEASAWRLDEDGTLVIELKRPAGESRFVVVAECDVLVMQGVGYADAVKAATIPRGVPGAALKPWLRPLPGADPRDPEVARLAKSLSGKLGDLSIGLPALEKVVAERIHEAAGATDQAGEALLHGRGSTLGRVRASAAVLLAAGVPTRLIAAVPVREGGDPKLLFEVYSPPFGWLRVDASRRTPTLFPWPEGDDLVVAHFDADQPVTTLGRRTFLTCSGGVTAGPKSGGLYACQELVVTTCSRATAKQVLPVLAEAFAETRSEQRRSGAPIDTLAAPRARACPPLVEWASRLTARPGASTDKIAR